MRKILTALALLAVPAAAQDKSADMPSPPEIVAAAPKSDWVAIAASDLLVMDLAPDPQGRARRVVIQLIPPPFSQGWIGNIRKLAAAHWWDGTSVNRVQDNYVAQWGDAESDSPAKAKPLPNGLATVPQDEYAMRYGAFEIRYQQPKPGFYLSGTKDAAARFFAPLPTIANDAYAPALLFHDGWPVGVERAYEAGERRTFVWPVHCYGMVGVGRGMPPDTGSGAELYAVIGHAPRHLDRNIALVGRVIEGIENLSSLPRGTAALGVYATPQERVPIVSIRIGSDVAGLPAYEYLSTESASFARYADARANRRDPFFIRPAGGADVCNIPVPVRRAQ